ERARAPAGASPEMHTVHQSRLIPHRLRRRPKAVAPFAFVSRCAAAPAWWSCGTSCGMNVANLGATIQRQQAWQAASDGDVRGAGGKVLAEAGNVGSPALRASAARDGAGRAYQPTPIEVSRCASATCPRRCGEPCDSGLPQTGPLAGASHSARSRLV